MGTHAGEFVKDLIPQGGSHDGTGEKRKEGATQAKGCRVPAAPPPHPPALPWEWGGGRRAGTMGVKLSLEKRGCWGECGFSFVSHHPTPFLITRN